LARHVVSNRPAAHSARQPSTPQHLTVTPKERAGEKRVLTRAPSHSSPQTADQSSSGVRAATPTGSSSAAESNTLSSLEINTICLVSAARATGETEADSTDRATRAFNASNIWRWSFNAA